MNFSNENKCGEGTELPAEVQEQLALLDRSRQLILQIMAGIAMQYKALDVQRAMLLDQTRCPDTFQPECYADPQIMRVSASALVLASLCGFQNQAEMLACQACARGENPDCLEPQLNAIVILVGLLRFARLLQADSGQEPAQQTVETVEAEDLDTAIV